MSVLAAFADGSLPRLSQVITRLETPRPGSAEPPILTTAATPWRY